MKFSHFIRSEAEVTIHARNSAGKNHVRQNALRVCKLTIRQRDSRLTIRKINQNHLTGHMVRKIYRFCLTTNEHIIAPSGTATVRYNQRDFWLATQFI